MGGLHTQIFGLLQSSSLLLRIRRRVAPCNEARANEKDVPRLQGRLLPLGDLVELGDCNLVSSDGMVFQAFFYSPRRPVQQHAPTADPASSIPQSCPLMKCVLLVKFLMTETVIVFLASEKVSINRHVMEI